MRQYAGIESAAKTQWIQIVSLFGLYLRTLWICDIRYKATPSITVGIMIDKLAVLTVQNEMNCLSYKVVTLDARYNTIWSVITATLSRFIRVNCLCS